MSLPWRRYVPEDLTDDPRFLELSESAGFLYMLLAHRALRHGALKANPELYRRLWGGRFRDFDSAWSECVRAFDIGPDELIHFDWAEDAVEDSLRRTKSEAEKKRAQRSKNANVHRDVPRDVPGDSTGTSPGCPAPRARADGTGRDGTGRTAPSELAQQQTKELFPGSDPEPETRQVRRPIAALATAGPRPVDVEVVDAPSPHKEFVAFWCQAFEQVTGRRYAFTGGKDGNLVKQMLQRCGGNLADLKDRALRILADPPGWIAKDGCVDLATLSRCLNQVVSKGHVQELTPTAKRMLEIQAQKGLVAQ